MIDRAKASIKNNALTLEANLPKEYASTANSAKISYLEINFNKLQSKDWHFLIAKNKNLAFLKPFGKLEVNITQKNNLGYFEAHLNTVNGKDLLESLK